MTKIKIETNMNLQVSKTYIATAKQTQNAT